MLISIVCYWLVGLSSAYYLTFHTSAQYYGVWYGLTASIVALSFLLGWRFYRKSNTFLKLA